MITVITGPNAPASGTARDFLVRNRVPHQWLDLTTDPLAKFCDLGRRLAGCRLPAVLFEDGTMLEAPETFQELRPAIAGDATGSLRSRQCIGGRSWQRAPVCRRDRRATSTTFSSL